MNEQNEQPLDDIMADPLADPAGEIAALTAERDEFRDKFMRALADAENSRKRADKDRRDAEQYGGSRLARDLLPVHDALTRALDAAGDEQRAAIWFKHQPLPGWGGKTAHDLVREGKSDRVLDYLESVRAGVYS